MQGLEIGKSRKIIVKNDGRVNSSDAGILLLQQVEQKHRIIEKLSDFFTDKEIRKKLNIAWLLYRPTAAVQPGGL